MNRVPAIKFDWMDQLLDPTIIGILVGVVGLGALVSAIWLKNAPFDRRSVIFSQYPHLVWQVVVWLVSVAGFHIIDGPWKSSVGIFAVVLAGYISVRVFRLVLSIYLFLRSPKAGVPLLLIDMGTIFFGIFVILSLVKHALNIDLVSMLATSAVLSLIVGLALQETLGNMMAGVALSVTPAFEIGDWIDVKSGGTPLVGQVDEIHWRAVVVRTLSNELITIPNKILVGSAVLNLSDTRNALLRSFVMKLDARADVERSREIILKTLKAHPAVRTDEAPEVCLFDVSESGMSFRAIYAPSDFTKQLMITDYVMSECLKTFAVQGIATAQIRINPEPVITVQSLS